MAALGFGTCFPLEVAINREPVLRERERAREKPSILHVTPLEIRTRKAEATVQGSPQSSSGSVPVLSDSTLRP